jgi:hypothetical protein
MPACQEHIPDLETLNGVACNAYAADEEVRRREISLVCAA